MLPETISIALIGLAGGLLPLLGRRSERVLHLFIPFATGVFLGVVFLHMLPEVAHMAALEERAHAVGASPADHDHEHAEHEHADDEHAADERGGGAVAADGAGRESARDHAHGAVGLLDPGGHHHHGSTPLWTFVMIGVVGLYLLENLVFRRPGSARHLHVTMGWASLLGLTVHAFTAGLALAGANEQADLAGPVYWSIVSHKLTETFSLTTVFMLGGYGVARVLAIVVAFSLVTPAGVWIGQLWVADLDTFGVQVLVALAAGTFLFVALCDLLPEVFHHREDALAKVVLLAGGIAVTYLMHELGG